jgi:hypothetical protein
VPKRITLYGYWDGTLIAENHFVRINGKYEMEKPATDLRLVVQDKKWYLEYPSKQGHNRIFLIENDVTSSFNKSFWE